jgi:hypothetical protein
LIHDESSNTEALALGLEMKHYYNSQIGEPRHFWIRDEVTDGWILGQIRLRKNGELDSRWSERCMFIPPKPPEEELSEEELLAIFAQMENDLVFRDAGGIKEVNFDHGALNKGLVVFRGNEGST